MRRIRNLIVTRMALRVRNKGQIILSLVLVFLLTSSTQVNALFGSECNKPKDAYASLLIKYKNEMGKAGAKAISDFTDMSMRIRVFQSQVQRECKLATFDISNRCVKDKITPEYRLLEVRYAGGVPTPNLSAAKRFLDLRYRVIANNPKCFSPLAVAQAQQALKM